jgi:hypothetical protein
MRTPRISLVPSLVGLLLLAAACSSSNKNTNNTPSNGTGGESMSTGGGESAGMSSTDATGGSTGMSTDTGGASANGGSTSTNTGGSGGVCVPDTTKSCFSCPPSSFTEYLNACTDATCQKFDNASKNVPDPLPAIP